MLWNYLFPNWATVSCSELTKEQRSHNTRTESDISFFKEFIPRICYVKHNISKTRPLVQITSLVQWFPTFFFRLRTPWQPISINCTLHISKMFVINPLKPELNPICYLLALLGAHHFLHVSRIRVKLLTFRLLMSYIYGAPILDVSRSHTTTQYSR